jgi:hypothetical protein
MDNEGYLAAAAGTAGGEGCGGQIWNIGAHQIRNYGTLSPIGAAEATGESLCSARLMIEKLTAAAAVQTLCKLRGI